MSNYSPTGYGLVGQDTEQYYAEYAEILTFDSPVTLAIDFESPAGGPIESSPVTKEYEFESLVGVNEL